MPEFFLELFSEEIPARMQRLVAEDLHSVAMDFTIDSDTNEVAKIFCGPRRLAVTVNIPAEKPGTQVEVRGPRSSAPEAALAGFLGKHNAGREDVTVEDGYYVIRRSEPPIPMSDFIEQRLSEFLTLKIRWPKSMRWGQSGDFAWVRPLRRIVCLLDGKIIPIKLGPVIASNLTEGHRSHSSKAFSISSATDWKERLHEHFVIVDQDDRSDLISKGIKEKAAALGLSVAEDEYLLNEVNGLVEWPVPLIGKIDQQFMSLPPEVRELSMKVNQRYFALRDADGKPAPYFAFVANLDAPDGGAAIIAGNERVLRARLSDARHFWDIDLKTSLDELVPKLDKITFHAKIGSQGERAKRIAELAKDIAKALHASDDEAKQAEWAGLLSKADLVTGMVGEFPELQGLMGGYYAEKNPRGWDGAVVGPAIKAHYLPKGPSDVVPSGVVAVSVALADKLDTLVQFFRINEKPTGSGDPYALRRAVLGVIRIILENNLRLSLKSFLHGDPSLFDFIIERLRVKLRSDGNRYDILDAVLAADRDDDLVRLMKRVDAVSQFSRTDDGKNLLAAYRRAASILKIEDTRDGPHSGSPNENLFEGVEKELAETLNQVARNVLVVFNDEVGLLAAERFEDAMRMLASLRAPVDAFFDKVTVNAPEPELRLNRLRLLAQLRDTMHQIADFSKIVG